MSPASPWRYLVVGVFFDPTIRYGLLRIVCASTLVLLISFPARGVTKPYPYVVSSVTFTHHLASAFGRRFSLPGVIDFILVLVEVVAYIYPFNTFTRWSAQGDVLAVTITWIVAISLMLLAVLRFAKSFATGWRYLWTRYDVREAKRPYGSIPDGVIGTGRVSGADRPAVDGPVYVLFGRKIWEAQLIGETPWIIVMRGIFAIFLITMITIFALFNIVLEPVRESGLVPAKEIRATNLPNDFAVSTPVVWNVIVTRMMHPVDPTYTPDDTLFASAVEVVPMWDTSSDETGPPCSFAPDMAGSTFPYLYYKATALYQYATFHCPARVPIPEETRLHLTPAPYSSIRPDLIVTVNFTKLNIAFNNSIRNIPSNSVQVLLGLTNDTNNVVLRTLSTTLVPGMNIVGMANLLVRQQFDAKAMYATFGLFDSYETFLISEIAHVSTDPMASTSSLITQAPDIATIRITSQTDTTEWRIIQDYRDKSALSGFASVGGLWSFLGGIFAVIFGTSILQIVFGMKPISIFGLVHLFQADRIQSVCLDKYPQLPEDLAISPDRWGFITFLVHYLIDVDLLYGPNKNFSNHSTSTLELVPLDNSNSGADNELDSVDEKLSDPVLTA